MADFAPNFTPRIRFNYRVLGDEHSFIWRTGRAVDDISDFMGRATFFLNELAPLRYVSWTLLGVEWAQVDSDIFLPYSMPAIDPGAASEIGATTQRAITQYRFEARSNGPTGARGSFSIFGLSLSTEDAIVNDFRIFGIENATISAALGRLTEIGGLRLACVDGHEAFWKPYVNVKVNDHWLYEKRG